MRINNTQDNAFMFTWEADVLKLIPVPMIKGKAKHIVENIPAKVA